QVVADEPAEMFATGATQQLLASYCWNRMRVEFLQRQIDGITEFSDTKVRAILRELNKTIDMNTRNMITIATKLRITNRSRYTDQTIKAESAKVPKGAKTWTTDYESAA